MSTGDQGTAEELKKLESADTQEESSKLPAFINLRSGFSSINDLKYDTYIENLKYHYLSQELLNLHLQLLLLVAGHKMELQTSLTKVGQGFLRIRFLDEIVFPLLVRVGTSGIEKHQEYL